MPVGGRLLLPGNIDKNLWLFGLLDKTAALLALVLGFWLPALPTMIGLDIPIGVEADVAPSRLLLIAVAENDGVDDREELSGPVDINGVLGDHPGNGATT